MINKFVKVITFGHFGTSTSRKKRGIKDVNGDFYSSGKGDDHADRSRTLPLSRPTSGNGSQLDDGIVGPKNKRGSTKKAWVSKSQASTLSNGSIKKWLPGELNRTVSDGENAQMSTLVDVYEIDGHLFDVFDDGNNAVTWCDHCLQSVCGMIHARRCIRCNLTCHWQCCPAVQVSCNQYFQQNLLDTIKASTPSSSQASLFYETLMQSFYDTSQDTLTISSYTSTLPSSAPGAWAHYPSTDLSSYSTVYSTKSLQSAPDPGENTVRPLSEGHYTMQLSAPSFVRLLPEMCSVHTETRKIHRLKSESHMTKEEWSSNRESLSKHLKEASHTAVFTPYDLSSLDYRSLQRYGIQVRTLSHRSLSSFTQPNAFLAPGQEISDLGLMLGDDKDGKVRWNLAELQRRISIFSSNTHGLSISLESKDSVNDGELRRYRCTGTIRVYIILIRTVRLAPGTYSPALTSSSSSNSIRPSSIFDLVNKFNDSEEKVENLISSDTQPVWLPRGISKLLHIDLAMTTQEVISSLLKIFQIKDNPKKFALYEHTIEGDKEVSVRKLRDKECPLLLVMTWASTTLDEFNSTLLIKRLVLQENETNDIDWHAFTVPELRNFLNILDKEEQEYKRQIIAKFQQFREKVESFKQMRQVDSGLGSATLSDQTRHFTENTS